MKFAESRNQNTRAVRRCGVSLSVDRRQLEVESVLGAQDEFGHLDGRSLLVDRQLEVLEDDRDARLQLVHREVLTDAVPA